MAVMCGEWLLLELIYSAWKVVKFSVGSLCSPSRERRKRAQAGRKDVGSADSCEDILEVY